MSICPKGAYFFTGTLNLSDRLFSIITESRKFLFMIEFVIVTAMLQLLMLLYYEARNRT